jgi:hypothetical protein
MPAFVPSDVNKKVANIKPIHSYKNEVRLTNLSNPFRNPFESSRVSPVARQPEFKLPIPGEGLPRIIHYCADQSGCGFWRMLWPGDELLSQNKAVIMTLYQMVLFAPFYQGIDAVRLQRQCTPTQLEFVKFLRQVSDELKRQTGKGFRIIWEVDDICGPPECIPDYNVCKSAFTDPSIGDIIREIVHHCDEMVVVSEIMREHYIKYFNYNKISVIPNYAPKYWLSKGIDEQRLVENLRDNKKKPRILYAGSATHFDILNKNQQMDDFGHVVDAIIRDIVVTKKYQWVFMGGIPSKLRQFIGKGVEFHDWREITEYPNLISEIKPNVMYAPLADNIFSRAKANIKLIEAGALGIPMIAQDLPCYNSDGWKYLFRTSDELFQSISQLVNSEQNYKEAIRDGKAYADRFWLRDHVDEWNLLYTTEYGDNQRKENKSFYGNNIQQF